VIKSFRIQNFKILQDISIEPSQLNVIIGPNGSGKSSLLQAIDFMRAFFLPSIDLYLERQGWKYRDIPNLKGSSKTIKWDLAAELNGDADGRGSGIYEYSITLSPKRYLGIGREQLMYTPPQGERVSLLKRVGRNIQVFHQKKNELVSYLAPNLPTGAVASFAGGPGRKDAYFEMNRFARWVRRFRYFSTLDPKSMRNPDRGKYQFLGASGEHLAPVIANLKSHEPELFEKLVQRLRAFFPNLSDITFSGQGWGWRSIRLHEKHGAKEYTLNNRQVSDGLLRLLAITSFLYSDPIPTIVMFEEPENGVHPHILREMVHVLKELTLRKTPNRTQVFFTTHSPYVLDEFKDHPEQVWVADHSYVKGGSRIVRLSDQSQLEKVKKSFESLGDAWFFNAIGGNPPTTLF